MLTWPKLLVVVVGAVLLALMAFVRWSRAGPGGEPFTGFLWIVIRVYTRLMHRTSFAGREHVPDARPHP